MKRLDEKMKYKKTRKGRDEAVMRESEVEVSDSMEEKKKRIDM